jgi:hypothetical protein
MTNRSFIVFVVSFFSCFLSSSFSFAQSKKEIRNANKYFNIKLENRQIQETETIDFKLHNGLAIVEVIINCKSYNFIFDTGTMTLFSNSLAKNSHTGKSEFSMPAADVSGITTNGISAKKINSWCEIREIIQDLGTYTVELLNAEREKISIDVKRITEKSLLENL